MLLWHEPVCAETAVEHQLTNSLVDKLLTASHLWTMAAFVNSVNVKEMGEKLNCNS